MEEKKLTPAEERERMKEQFKKEMLEDKARAEALRKNRLANQAEQILEHLIQATGTDEALIADQETQNPKELALEKFKQEYLNPSPTQLPAEKAPGTKTIGEDVLEAPDVSKELSSEQITPSVPSKTLGDEAV